MADKPSERRVPRFVTNPMIPTSVDLLTHIEVHVLEIDAALRNNVETGIIDLSTIVEVQFRKDSRTWGSRKSLHHGEIHDAFKHAQIQLLKLRHEFRSASTSLAFSSSVRASRRLSSDCLVSKRAQVLDRPSCLCHWSACHWSAPALCWGRFVLHHVKQAGRAVRPLQSGRWRSMPYWRLESQRNRIARASFPIHAFHWLRCR